MTTQTAERPTSKPDILRAAVKLAKAHGLRNFSRSEVAEEAGVASATVSYHFGEMPKLRREVVEYAIKNEVLSILADARADRGSSELFTRMPAALKKKVAAYVAR
jgi:AcrR family transcriptional regulator